MTTSGALATGLALGKTIVASDLSVFRELLTNGKSALLIDPQDKNQFASALIGLAKDQQLRTNLSSEIAKLQFGDQSWESIAVKTIHVYDKVRSVASTP